jgi:hypothetical protein
MNGETVHPELESALDALAEAERASSRAGIESRIFEATRTALSPGAGASAPAVIGRIGLARGRRLAAGLAIMGAAGAAWIAVRTGGNHSVVAQTSLEQGLDAWLSVALDEANADELDELKSRAAGLADSLDSGWEFDDLDIEDSL